MDSSKYASVDELNQELEACHCTPQTPSYVKGPCFVNITRKSTGWKVKRIRNEKVKVVILKKKDGSGSN